MTKNSKLLISVISILLIGVLFITFLYSSEEDKIKKQLTTISKIMTFDTPISGLRTLRKAEKLKSIFFEKTKFTLRLNNKKWITVKTSSEIKEKYLIARKFIKNLIISYENINIEIIGENATVNLNLIASGMLDETEDIKDNLEIIIKFSLYNDSNWLITSIENKNIDT